MFRKILVSTALTVAFSGMASAADLPSHAGAPAFVPPPSFTWTGVYAGGEVGYQFGTIGTTLETFPGQTGLASYNANGILGGAHLGVNVQTGQLVYGIEADIEGTGVKGSNTGLGGSLSYSSREPVESAYRLRLGYAWDRTLFYAAGGFVVADFNNTYTFNGVSPTGTNTDSDNHTRFGWTIGGGVEYALTSAWSARAEYRYTTFGTRVDTLVNSEPGFQAHVHESDNSIRVGFSYNFSVAPPTAPVVAKY